MALGGAALAGSREQAACSAVCATETSSWTRSCPGVQKAPWAGVSPGGPTGLQDPTGQDGDPSSPYTLLDIDWVDIYWVSPDHPGGFTMHSELWLNGDPLARPEAWS